MLSFQTFVVKWNHFLKMKQNKYSHNYWAMIKLIVSTLRKLYMDHRSDYGTCSKDSSDYRLEKQMDFSFFPQKKLIFSRHQNASRATENHWYLLGDRRKFLSETIGEYIFCFDFDRALYFWKLVLKTTSKIVINAYQIVGNVHRRRYSYQFDFFNQ